MLFEIYKFTGDTGNSDMLHAATSTILVLYYTNTIRIGQICPDPAYVWEIRWPERAKIWHGVVNYSGSGLGRVKIFVAPRKSLQGAKTFFGLGQKNLESESGPDLGTCNG